MRIHLIVTASLLALPPLAFILQPAAADPICYMHLRGQTVNLGHLCGDSSPAAPSGSLSSPDPSIQPYGLTQQQDNLPYLQSAVSSQPEVNLPLLEYVEFVSDPELGPMLVGSLYNPTSEPTVEAGIYGMVHTSEQYNTETAIAPVIEPYRWARFELPVNNLSGNVEDFGAEVFVLDW
ncbi:MAG: hypothetical protein AAF921_09010 [Cyanobacteria bacterium P01_D01_bin.44]